MTDAKHCAVIDNYDSFTYNLVRIIRELGVIVDVFKNNKLDILSLSKYDKILLSPGPGLPNKAGKLIDIINMYAKTKSILGICLGHQAIAEAFGGILMNLDQVYHGQQTEVYKINSNDIFRNLPQSFLVGRYHSWIVSRDNFPKCLSVIAEDINHNIMALKHNKYNIYGIQFHPESILTPQGKQILENWLNI